MAENNEVQELREDIYKLKQVFKGVRDGVFSMLNDS
jgi:toxic protein SymE